MALPSTGSISMEQVRTELKRTGAISLNDPDVRKLAGKPNGIISMNDLRGKSSVKHKIVEILNSYSPPDQGTDVETYPSLIFPKEHFVNGVVRIKEFETYNNANFADCTLWLADDKTRIYLDSDYGGLEGAKQKFKFEISDSNNNPLKDAYVRIHQIGGYYDDWGVPLINRASHLEL